MDSMKEPSNFGLHLRAKLASDRHFSEYANQESAHRCHSGESYVLKQFVEVNPIGLFWRKSPEPLALCGTR